VSAAHAAAHGGAASAAAAPADDPYYHAPCMPAPGEGEGAPQSPLAALRKPAMAPAPAGANPNDGDPPTGELCGSVFWTKLNQRFHRLWPDNETFVWEMERSILNVGVAALGWPGSGGQGPNGTGIRYFANLDFKKQYPSMHASCCEGQGTRLFGSLPEYIYTLRGAPGGGGAAAALYVDLFADSAIAFQAAGGEATLLQDTAWPYGTLVQLTLTLPAAQEFDLALRVPAWVAAASVGVVVDGAPWPARGAPGTYLHLNKTWPAGASLVTFALPMGWQAVRYEGASQLPPFERWAYLYGPVLMAVQGGWNASLGAMVMPQPGGAPLDPAAPGEWLLPAGGGNTLHFDVKGAPGWGAKPYYEVQGAEEVFSCFPHFG